MPTDFFQFKEFSVSHSRCAMKVNTDSCILGSYASFPAPKRILDIGTGSGILALMLAQKYPASAITAVELEPQAAEQAAENFKKSQWADRLNVWRGSIQKYSIISKEPFDLIVSNPPYFSQSSKAKGQERHTARHTDTLALHELAQCVAALLAKDGVFTMIFPVKEAQAFDVLAESSGLYPMSKLMIADNPTKNFNRVITSYSFSKQSPQADFLYIKDQNLAYTPTFTDLMRPYYLFF
jgi:tRNA1Val (adenine37-N6)-methyltransferase